MARPLKEPIAVEPFLKWCEAREAEIQREFDAAPSDRWQSESSAHRLVLFEIGWPTDSDARRYLRWRNESLTGLVERAVVEDALHHAGVDFYAVYLDVPDPKGPGDWVGRGRWMTDAEVLAAHTVYWRGGVSLRRLGDLLWERYGYSGSVSCATQLRRAFVNLGLPCRPVEEASLMAHLTHGLTRNGERPPLYKRWLNVQRHGQCDATLRSGDPCPRAARPGTSACGYHQPDEMARRREQIAAVNAEGKNLLRWADREGVTA